MMSRTLAVILARGGSKRIPRKNIRPFLGKPMIAWSIEAARAAGVFDSIVVSTDDAEIAGVAREWGAETPFVRPAELADDHATTIPVVSHAIRHMAARGDAPREVCCLYAAAPLVQAADLVAGLDELRAGDWRYVFAAASCGFPIFRTFAVDPAEGVRMFFPEHRSTRSQDLPEAFHDAGMFYWGLAEAWLRGDQIFAEWSTVVRLPRWRVQDLDTTEDWERAERIATHLSAAPQRYATARAGSFADDMMGSAGDRSIVIRADASPMIGHGHVARCLSLADALGELGCRVALLTKRLPGALRARATSLGCEVVEFDDITALTSQADAEQCAAAVEKFNVRPTWVVVDGYGFDSRWHETIAATGARVLCIDDLANRPLACDVLLDQNPFEGSESRYDALVLPRCRRLLGPHFALLSSDYTENRGDPDRHRRHGKRVLVSFGGADPTHATAAAVAALSRLPDAELEIDVVLDPLSRQYADVNAMARTDRRIRLHDPQPSLAPLLARARLAIGGAGCTAWERLCMGVPSIVVPIADNQRPIARALDRARLAYVIDAVGLRFTAEVMEAASAALRADDCQTVARGMEICDGLGARRVAAVLVATRAMPLRLRHVATADRALILRWANDPDTRRASLSQAVITPADHAAWFARRVPSNAACAFYMATTINGLPLGNVRFERQGDIEDHDQGWTLSFTVAPEFRGHGLGGRIVELAVRTFVEERHARLIVAAVRHENAPSSRLLRDLGFRPIRTDATATWLALEPEHLRTAATPRLVA